MKLALSAVPRRIFDLSRHPLNSIGMGRVDVAIAIVTRGLDVLICQRKAGAHLGGFWEFPGGKCEPGETIEQCLERELREELAITARPFAKLGLIEHDYPHAQVRLHPVICTHASGEVQNLECQAHRWIPPSALREHRFPPANDRLIEEVIAFLTKNPLPPSPAT